jgi:hypothetical protein
LAVLVDKHFRAGGEIIHPAVQFLRRRYIMHKKRVVIANLLILMAVSFSITACNRGLRIGDLQTKSQTVELGDADSADVEIQMGAGALDVSGGASELLEASFTYNVAELDPRATYADGRLEVKDSGVEGGIASLFDLDKFRNEWDLKLSEDVPMEMKIGLGAGPTKLALGTLALSRLNIAGGAGDVELDLKGSQALRRLDFDLGAGKVTIDLTGEWQHDLDARIGGGLGDINLRLPSDVGVRIEVHAVGAIDANGLTRDGDTYTNAAYGTSDVTLRIHIDAGVGRINLDVE